MNREKAIVSYLLLKTQAVWRELTQSQGTAPRKKTDVADD